MEKGSAGVYYHRLNVSLIKNFHQSVNNDYFCVVKLMIPWDIIFLGGFLYFPSSLPWAYMTFIIWWRKMLLKIQNQSPSPSFYFTNVVSAWSDETMVADEWIFQGIRNLLWEYSLLLFS